MSCAEMRCGTSLGWVTDRGSVECSLTVAERVSGELGEPLHNCRGSVTECRGWLFECRGWLFECRGWLFECRGCSMVL